MPVTGYDKLPIVLNVLMNGLAFSLCTLVTLRELFYRRIRRSFLFPVMAGLISCIAAYFQIRLDGSVHADPFCILLLHTAAVFLLLTDRSRDHFLSLIFAEMFSTSLIRSIRTAVMSLSRGSERSFTQLTLLYLATYIIAAVYILFLKRLVRSDDREPAGMLQMFLLSGIMFFVTSVIARSFTSSDYVADVSPEAAIPSALMLMSVTVLLLLSVKQRQAEHFRELNEMSERYMAAQARHFEQTRAADNGMRMLRHDMKNHITVMNGLYESGRTEELGRYLRELSSSFAETQAVNITGSEIADAIIMENKALAAQAGVSLEAEGSLRGLSVNAVTLCTVLSNLLDNAIEAAEQTGSDRTVTFTARNTASFCYISIVNPCKGYVDTSADMVTGKPDSTCHGLGLKSVRSALEKCGGTLELSCKESGNGYIFTAEVILPSGVAEPASPQQ